MNEQKVYSVSEFDYDTNPTLGIFSEKEKAFDYTRKLFKGDQFTEEKDKYGWVFSSTKFLFSVTEWTLDKE